jgi:pyruvate dehydrogenase E1 component alpha subunit
MAVTSEVEKRSVSKAAGNGSEEPTRGRVERERLRTMMLIRRFEERTYQEYSTPRVLPDDTKEMKIGGFCHLYSGQEAIAVGIAAIFNKGVDALVNGYRCHGHSLALGMDPRAAIAELYGKETGCSKGKGGSMHLFQADVGNHGGHGIVGGHIPLGLGMAFAQQYKKSGGVTYCLFGDGAVNQGTFNEALNMASLLKVPAIFIVENNGVAMGTQVERHSAEKDLAERGCGFNMPHYNIDANDLDTVIGEMTKAADRARRGEGPCFISANTYRFRGHSMSDPMKYRKNKEGEWLPEVDEWKKRDPIGIYAERLRDKGLLSDAQQAEIEEGVAEEINKAFDLAEADPHPSLQSRFDDALAETYPYQPK